MPCPRRPLRKCRFAGLRGHHSHLCRKLLNFLLSGEDPEAVVEHIHEYLRNLATQMREFAIPVQKYTIFTVRRLSAVDCRDADYVLSNWARILRSIQTLTACPPSKSLSAR